MTDAAEVVAVKPAVAPRKLPEARFRQAEHVRTVWNVVPETGTEAEALLDPGYWSHNARKLKPTDIIEAMPDDGTWYARYIVRSAGPLGAEVFPLEFHKLGNAELKIEGVNDRFAVKWKGPHHKFAVIRSVDGSVVQPGFQNAEDATRWVAENARNLMADKKAA